MADLEQRLAALGTVIPEIALPRVDLDLEKWAVIACDQFTQDRSYWETVRKTAGSSPSTLNLIFPEVYLEDPDRENRIKAIRKAMESVFSEGILAPPRRGLVYIERGTSLHPRRRGLVLALDLEEYDWAPAARPLIRSTEGTVPERLLPRMEIRRSAPLETPHIIVLIDDQEDVLLPGLGARAKQAQPCYDTPLMGGAGTVSGWFLDREEDWRFLAEGLEALAHRAETRYGDAAPGDRPFLYAMGDGNHSLATAKAVWEEYKKQHQGEPGLEKHPARYALVELENLYDPGIAFEPIHRLIFGAAPEAVLETLKKLPGFSSRPIAGPEELSRLVAEEARGNRYGLISAGQSILVETSAAGIATEPLQPLLDSFISESPGRSIDYIHGEKDLIRLAEGTGEKPAVGILLPPVRKDGLFRTVARSGPLPRKSFSMGEAEEKRFYLECRKLFG